MYGSVDADEIKGGGGGVGGGAVSNANGRRTLPPSSRSRRAGFETTGPSNRGMGARGVSSRRGFGTGRAGGGGGPVLKSLYHTVRASDHFKAAARKRREQRRRLDEPPPGSLYSSALSSSGAASAGGTTTGRGHSYVYTVLNPRSHQPAAQFFKKFISIVICIDLVFFIASTEPQWADHPIFYYSEAVTSSIFLIEYVARLATCTESTRFRPHGPILGRIRYMLTVPAIIDALATFPFFIELLTPLELPTLTFLRMFRLLRILKTEGFAKAFDSVNRVVYYNREILYVAAMLCIFLVLVTAVAMYYLRPPNEVDEADFSSIAATMYLTTLLLTGQGGPSGDLPWYTQAIVLITGIFSVAMFAIPASMLTWGFEAEAERLAVRARKKRSQSFAETTSSTSESSDAYASSSSLDTSDEEYQKIIGGQEEDGDAEGGGEDPEKARAMREMLDMFHRADIDDTGTLTKREFIRMVEPLLEAAAARHSPPSPSSAAAGGRAAGLASSTVLSAVRAAAAAASARSSSSPDAAALASRVSRLEDKVDNVSSKLDQLIAMMAER